MLHDEPEAIGATGLPNDETRLQPVDRLSQPQLTSAASQRDTTAYSF